jgi:restriction system protein
LLDRPEGVRNRETTRYQVGTALEEFRRATSGDKGDTLAEVGQDATTPEERIEASYQTVVKNLEEELLGQIKARSPAFFESLVVDLLVRLGYGGSLQEAGQRLGRSGDGGVDGIIKEDKLGLDVVYVQAKRWDGPVGSPTVQAFAGSLEGHKARKGVLITTSRFSEDAIRYVGMIEKRIVLIDGPQLVKYMIEQNVGVSEVARYSVKRVALEDLDYYDEGHYVAGVPVEPASSGG